MWKGDGEEMGYLSYPGHQSGAAFLVGLPSPKSIRNLELYSSPLPSWATDVFWNVLHTCFLNVKPVGPVNLTLSTIPSVNGSVKYSPIYPYIS